MARFRKVDPKMWNDEKFQACSEKGKMAFFYILTHPHMTALGAMRATGPGLAAELGWRPSVFSRAIREPVQTGMVEIDEDRSCIALPNFLKYNEPESPNVVKAWKAAADLVPEGPLKRKTLARAMGTAQRKGEAFAEAFLEAFPEAFAKAMPNQEPEPEPEPEQKQEPEKEGGTETPLPHPSTRGVSGAGGARKKPLSPSASEIHPGEGGSQAPVPEDRSPPDPPKKLTENQREIQDLEEFCRSIRLEPCAPGRLAKMRQEAGGVDVLRGLLEELLCEGHLSKGWDYIQKCIPGYKVKWRRRHPEPKGETARRQCAEIEEEEAIRAAAG